jgi:acid phosphatase (class A)
MRTDLPLAQYKNIKRNTAVTGFPASRWDPDLFSLAILPEFLSIKGTAKQAWEEVKLDAPDAPNSDLVKDEITNMLQLAVTVRPEALGEILEEDQNFQLTLLHLLMIDGASHPQTFLLMKLAARVGEMMMIHLKRLFNRPRPSQICPILYPPLPVPGHAAYPAGHALIAWLTFLCLTEDGPVPADVHEALQKLVDRIIENRRIAGLHFRSDNDAGKKAAEQIFETLKKCPLYKTTLTAAKKEWQ